jgi:hypothetical protein
MPMDPKLAALYGTAQVDESDVEKLAAAKLAEELADDEQVDVAEMSDEQINELAAQVLAEEEATEGSEVEEPAEKTSAAEETEEEAVEETDEAQEKLAEADYLGRVMAHAYVNELTEIEKEAGPRIDAAKKWVSEKYKSVSDAIKSKKPAKGEVKAKFDSAKKAVGEHVSRNKKKYIGGAAAVGTAGAAYGGYKAYKHFKGKKKESAAEPTALDILAERRALEILKENGIDLAAEEQGAEVEEPTTEKTSASEQEMKVLANAVEQRAFELLQANGYIQEETEETEEKTE